MSRYTAIEVSLAVRGFIAAVLSYTAASARELGLSLSEVAALEHLQSSGELTPTQLGYALALPSGTITALVDRLERSGFVERVRHPRDRRSVLIRPTGSASQRVLAQRQSMSLAMRSATEALSEEQRAAVGQYLKALTAAIAQHTVHGHAADHVSAEQPGER